MVPELLFYIWLVTQETNTLLDWRKRIQILLKVSKLTSKKKANKQKGAEVCSFDDDDDT